MTRILGYANRLSVSEGESIEFKVSCADGEKYSADIVRLICGDTNPRGPGFRENTVESVSPFLREGRRQDILAGSYLLVPGSTGLVFERGFTLQIMIWPTTPGKGRQALIGKWSEVAGKGFALVIDESGAPALLLGDGGGNRQSIGTGRPLRAREWCFIGASYDAKTGAVRLYQESATSSRGADGAVREVFAGPRAAADNDAPLMMAAAYSGMREQGLIASSLYNGKLDSPRLAGIPLSRSVMETLKFDPLIRDLGDSLLAFWDFSRDITSQRVSDLGACKLHGTTVNLPARAMKGFNWSGRWMNWQQRPDEYGAIHFHEDDLYDAGWKTDFILKVPDGLRSGVYAAKIKQGDEQDYVPFYVRPRRGTRSADLCFLAPTSSYLAYGNEHIATTGRYTETIAGHLPALSAEDLFLRDHPEYGGSLYDLHSDGSGICYSSRLRPLLNFRPAYQASWFSAAGSFLWQFNADTHIVDWLENSGFAYDVVTDEDLHEEGYGLLAHYRTVMTGSHPEYWSEQMRSALVAYTQQGGRLAYLGGNGFYWRIAYHPELPGVIELRRAEGGIRAWSSEPGEYYHSFTGEYGGLWERQGQPPHRLAGIGCIAQGFDVSSYYRRQAGSFDPRAAFIFEGIGRDELIGNFGLTAGGAAGVEIDCFDRNLGSPPHTLLLASSENHSDVYFLVPERLLVVHPFINAPRNAAIRADMVFFECPQGGATFSVGSIAWAGSLSHNGYNNNVSRITKNVLQRFLDPSPFVL